MAAGSKLTVESKMEIPVKSLRAPVYAFWQESFMRLQIVKNLGLLVLVVVGIASRANADTIIYTVPPGLAPGDTYRLVFVTSETTETTAASTNIADYNAFVTGVADAVPALAALGATWTVIGSTEAVSAVTNIGDPSGSIYDLDGLEVAASTAALFNTSAVGLLNPIDIDQYGDIVYDVIWSGTTSTGLTYSTAALGDADPVVGLTSQTNQDFLTAFYAPFNNQTYTSVYAISSELTVPTTPEPATIGLFALGGALSLLARRQRSRVSK